MILLPRTQEESVKVVWNLQLVALIFLPLSSTYEVPSPLRFPLISRSTSAQSLSVLFYVTNEKKCCK